MNHSCNEADFRLSICLKARVAKKYHYNRTSTIVVLSAAASSTENSVKENFSDVQGDTTLLKGKKGNTPCRNMDALWTWISGDISFPRDDENKDKFLLSAEDECHGTHSRFKKETYIS